MYATHIKHISILQNLRKQAVAAKILVMYRLLGVFYATKKGLYLFAQHSQYQYFSWKKKHLKLVIASGFCVAFLLRIKVEWQFCSKILEYFKLYLMPTPEAWKEAWWLYTTKLSSILEAEKLAVQNNSYKVVGKRLKKLEEIGSFSDIVFWSI